MCEAYKLPFWKPLSSGEGIYLALVRLGGLLFASGATGSVRRFPQLTERKEEEKMILCSRNSNDIVPESDSGHFCEFQ